MIAQPEGIVSRAGLCWFGMQQLPARLDAFEKEIPGIREAKDIEYIHRMRVASRRLRAALPLFADCFLQKQYLRWMEEIATITRALGEARDADVQIAFLQKQVKKSTSRWKSRHPDTADQGPPEAPALRYLLADREKKRSQLQGRVISALDALEKSRVIPDMKAAFSARENRIRSLNRALAYGVSPAASLHIESRLEALQAYKAWVSHPEAVAEHHATRIAAKKLRYTMEVFGPVYRLGLNKPLARVKRIQEILGDLHDCDVWIDHIARILLRERSLLRTENEEKRPDTATLASLKVLLMEREHERTILYRSFARFWESQERAGLWDGIRTTLVSGRKNRYRPAARVPEPEARVAVSALASAYPEGLSHTGTVTRLALMLFDNLLSLHQLGPEERFFLECAAMLHDIGWTKGQKQHNHKSAAIIIADETLPFDLPERGIISLAAFAHRGRSPPEQERYFRLLSEKQQKTALYLAAILRVADGLDYLRLDIVQEVHCVIDTRQVTLDIISGADSTVEKEHARMKSDLFVRVFLRELVIH